MLAVPVVNANTLEAVAKQLAEHASGSQIGQILRQRGLPDPDPSWTKWKRLVASVDSTQRSTGVANHFVSLIQEIMDPVRFSDSSSYEAAVRSMNVPLGFAGLALGIDGKVSRCTPAQTLGEAEQRARRLETELLRRGVHPDVLRFCRPELLVEDYFHAVLEATKSVADKIRGLTGMTEDGTALADAALQPGKNNTPRLAVTACRTDSERSEQVGLANLTKALFSLFRNPPAHEPRLPRVVNEGEALEAMTMLSYAHRRLDSAVAVPRSP